MNNFCKNCGNKIDGNTKFCSNCGCNIVNEKKQNKNVTGEMLYRIISGAILFLIAAILFSDTNNISPQSNIYFIAPIIAFGCGVLGFIRLISLCVKDKNAIKIIYIVSGILSFCISIANAVAIGDISLISLCCIVMFITDVVIAFKMDENN